MNQDHVLEEVRNRFRGSPSVEEVSGQILPLPNSFGSTAEHLFVNVIWKPPRGRDTQEILSQVRCDAQYVLEAIASQAVSSFCVSIVLSFYELGNGSSVRLYRTRVLADQLHLVKNGNFLSFCSGEESQDPAIEELLKSK